jgi:hypothetical protein
MQLLPSFRNKEPFGKSSHDQCRLMLSLVSNCGNILLLERLFNMHLWVETTNSVRFFSGMTMKMATLSVKRTKIFQNTALILILLGF